MQRLEMNGQLPCVKPPHVDALFVKGGKQVSIYYSMLAPIPGMPPGEARGCGQC